MHRGLWRLGAMTVSALTVVVLAGCSKTIGGNAVSDPQGAARPDRTSPATSSSRPAASGAAELLGELTTVDPCSLVDPAVFSQFGTPEVAPPDSLDECLVKIRTSAPEPVDLYVGNLDRSDSYVDLPGKKSTEVPGGLRVVDYDVGTDLYCSQLLVFPDGITLSVNGSVYTGEEPRLCDMVRAGMAKVVDVVRGGDVEHRDFADNSLGRLDPCELTPSGLVASVLKLASIEARDYPAEHTCSWTTPDNSARVRVMFGAGAPPKPTQGATEETIAGRASVLQPTPEAGNFSFCNAQTPHIGFRADGQAGLVEIATVFVRMQKGQVDAACGAVTAIATAVWTKLPPP